MQNTNEIFKLMRENNIRSNECAYSFLQKHSDSNIVDKLRTFEFANGGEEKIVLKDRDGTFAYKVLAIVDRIKDKYPETEIYERIFSLLGIGIECINMCVNYEMARRTISLFDEFEKNQLLNDVFGHHYGSQFVGVDDIDGIYFIVFKQKFQDGPRPSSQQINAFLNSYGYVKYKNIFDFNQKNKPLTSKKMLNSYICRDDYLDSFYFNSKNCTSIFDIDHKNKNIVAIDDNNLFVYDCEIIKYDI